MGSARAPFTHLLDKYVIFLQIGDGFLCQAKSNFSIVQRDYLYSPDARNCEFFLEVQSGPDKDIIVLIKNSKNQYLEWNYESNELILSEGITPNTVTSLFCLSFKDQYDGAKLVTNNHTVTRTVKIQGKEADSVRIFYKGYSPKNSTEFFIQISNYKSALFSKLGFWKINNSEIEYLNEPTLYSLYYRSETLIEINQLLVSFEPFSKPRNSIAPYSPSRPSENQMVANTNLRGNSNNALNYQAVPPTSTAVAPPQYTTREIAKMETKYQFEQPIKCSGTDKIEKLIEILRRLVHPSTETKKIVIFCRTEFYSSILYYYLVDKGFQISFIFSNSYLLSHSFTPFTPSLSSPSTTIFLVSDSELEYKNPKDYIVNQSHNGVVIHYDNPDTQVVTGKRYSLFMNHVTVYSIINLISEEEKAKHIIPPNYLSNSFSFQSPRKIFGVTLEVLWGYYGEKFPPFLSDIIQLMKNYNNLTPSSFREQPEPSIIIDLNLRISCEESLLITKANCYNIPIICYFFVIFLNLLPEKLLNFPDGVNISNFQLNIPKCKFEFLKEVFQFFTSLIASKRFTLEQTKSTFEEYFSSNPSSTIFDNLIKYYDMLFGSGNVTSPLQVPSNTPSPPPSYEVPIRASTPTAQPSVQGNRASLYPNMENYAMPINNNFNNQPPSVNNAPIFAQTQMMNQPIPRAYPRPPIDMNQMNYNSPMNNNTNNNMNNNVNSNINTQNWQGLVPRLPPTPPVNMQFYPASNPPPAYPKPNQQPQQPQPQPLGAPPQYKPQHIHSQQLPPPPSTSSQTMKIDFTEIQEKQIKITHQIGVGSFGAVFKGEYDGIIVAIKKFTGQLNSSSQTEINNFLEEITILCSCRHPNILRFYGVVLKPLMLVTEFAENGNLQQYYTKNKSLSWDMSLKFSKEIVRGLRYLHSRDPVIVHRDIKSLNILITSEMRCVIADFGLTAVKSQGYLNSFCGSPAWTAPEILRSQPYDEKADIYSLGIVFWEIFSKTPPYHGMQANGIISGVMHQCLRPNLPQNYNTLPHNVIPYLNLMVECWSDNPHQRPNCTQILDRLEKM